jgi:hypothetical protein
VAGGGTGAGGAGSSLAFTGLNSLWMSLGALVLVLAGAGLVEYSRPKPAHALSLRRQLATLGRRSAE